MNSSAAQDSRIGPSAPRPRSGLGATPSCALVSLAFVGAYGLANRLTSLRTDVGRGVFDWERAIPFVEWTIVPYLSIVLFFAASFFVCRDRTELERHVARVLLVLTISIACYAAFPLRFQFERPETTGAIGALFQLLERDRPAVQPRAFAAHRRAGRVVGVFRAAPGRLAAARAACLVCGHRRLGPDHLPTPRD